MKLQSSFLSAINEFRPQKLKCILCITNSARVSICCIEEHCIGGSWLLAVEILVVAPAVINPWRNGDSYSCKLVIGNLAGEDMGGHGKL